MAYYLYKGCKGKVLGAKNYQERLNALNDLEKSKEWVAERKGDGIWVAVISTNSSTKYISRSGQEKGIKIPINIPDDTVLIAEACFGSQESKRRRAIEGHDFVEVFDCLKFLGKDISHLPRIERQSYLSQFYSLDNQFSKYFKPIPTYDSNYVDAYISEPEGLILKPKNDGPYLCNGSKDPNWLKAKKHPTTDYILLNYKLSKATTKVNEPMLKCLVVGGYIPIGKLTRHEEIIETKVINGKTYFLIELMNVGSMLHETSKEVAQNFHKYKGKIVEVAHYGLFKSGASRHPGFLRFRNDKLPDECIFRE